VGARPPAFVAIAAAAVLVSCGGGAQWSAWKPPPGEKQTVARAIAKHVESGYRLSAHDGRLVAVIASTPQVTSGNSKIAIGAIAVRKAPQSNRGILIYRVDKTQDYTLCGLGSHCSIAGTPTQLRGRLVRREALELALYTFKFASGIDLVLTHLPLAPGQPTNNVVLFLRRTDVASALDQPLSKTLPRATPPLPNDADADEAATIDRLTLPHLYGSSTPTTMGAVILDPLSR
jgi:hypothetical protein